MTTVLAWIGAALCLAALAAAAIAAALIAAAAREVKRRELHPEDDPYNADDFDPAEETTP